MFNTSVTPLFPARGRARALDTWREAARLVGIRWRGFLEADPASRSWAFAAYVAALDAEEAAASEVAGCRRPPSPREEDDMELRHLRYFVAIAEERSITRAAERLWIAQPACRPRSGGWRPSSGSSCSTAIPAGVELTAAGEVFLERARATLAAAEDGPLDRARPRGRAGRARSGSGIATEAPARARAAAAGRLRAGPAGRRGHGVRVLQRHADARPARRAARRRDGPGGVRLGRAALAAGRLRAVGRARRPRTSARAPGPDRGRASSAASRRDHRSSRRRRATIAPCPSCWAGSASRPCCGAGGPARRCYAAVAAGDAIALTTAPAAAGGELVVRAAHAGARVRFALFWREETPAPALRELIRAADADAAPGARPAGPAAVA